MLAVGQSDIQSVTYIPLNHYLQTHVISRSVICVHENKDPIYVKTKDIYVIQIKKTY